MVNTMPISKANIVGKLHYKTKRNYLERMISKKVYCMKIAKKYEKEYWDGNRKYGYGGYKFIPGRWTKVAKKIIKLFKINKNSKILDIGCGKGFLLYEIKKLIPDCHVKGIDFSKYAIKNSHKDIKKYLEVYDARKKLPFKFKQFDLVISINCLHNFNIDELFFSLKEIRRISKKQYLVVESYRNESELFNLQCWALTCNSFFNDKDWEWIFKRNKINGLFELIYFP